MDVVLVVVAVRRGGVLMDISPRGCDAWRGGAHGNAGMPAVFSTGMLCDMFV
jgi:hypothetical protein